MSDPKIAKLFADKFAEIGLVCPMRVVADAEVAFASGTAEPSGSVLVAGTGSIACKIVDHRLVRTGGGFGWLLGDEGSGFWIGREAIRATLRALQRGGAQGPLATAVLRKALPELDLAGGPLAIAHDGTERVTGLVAQLITAVNAAPPIKLAEYAELVAALAAEDPLATMIIEHAAVALRDTLDAARTPTDRGPVVLVGSVVRPGSPVGTRLAELLPGTPVSHAADPVAGAAWLAALDAYGPGAPRPR